MVFSINIFLLLLVVNAILKKKWFVFYIVDFSMKRYFIHNGKKKLGPYEVPELQSMHIKTDYAVWDPATALYTKAGEVSELQVLFSSQTATLPVEISVPQQVEISHRLEEVNISQELEVVIRHDLPKIKPKKEKRKLSVIGWIIVSAFAILLLIAVYMFFR